MNQEQEKSIEPTNFIRQIIETDVASGKHGGAVVTRFPPEPNGYLHVGHVKSICLNFETAIDFNGECYLRFDDTNPLKESTEFKDAIEQDIRWLGFDWGDRVRHASDYFDDLYRYAEELIEKDLAYVDSLSAEDIRAYRGTLTEPGTDSPHRGRSREENLALFRGMRDGQFDEGEHVLRAKIDMQSPNINMRDPILYRIRKVEHHNTGDKWCIYPMYDFTHCISDAIEGITHSLCTLEFEDHRPLYDWVLDNVSAPAHPQQIEFSRLNLKFAVTSKRKLAELVEEGHVSGWDDPRMPTVRGMRRRGYPPAALRDMCHRVGITKKVNTTEMSLLENSVREQLGVSAPRRFGVLHPIKVVLDNYPEDQIEWMDAANHPQNPDMGSRKVPFSKELYIDADDFVEDPPKKFFRLKPGGAVRLKYGYIIDCHEVIKDDDGQVVELRCTYDPETRSGTGTSDRKVKGTIHWVSAQHAVDAEIRLYDRLFVVGNPTGDKDRDFKEFLNPDSLQVLRGCKLEPELASADPESSWQLERMGYFCIDRHDSTPENLVLNRTITLRDSWAKIEKQQAEAGL